MYLSKQKWMAAMIIALISVLSFSCDKQPIGPTGPDPIGPPPPGYYISIQDFRALYPGTGSYTVPAGTKKFRATVVSNAANESAGTFRLQDESGYGIRLYAAIGSPVYSLGSVLEVDPTGGGILELFNGDLELKSVPQAKVVPLNGVLTVTPRTATVAQILANKDTWTSSLVKITGVTSIVVGTSNSTGTNYTITDATGSITTFVRTASGITVNTAATTVTGYVSIFSSTGQITVRSASDFQ